MRTHVVRALAITTVALLTSSCTHGLLSGVPFPDRSRPVAMIETRGGVEYGATTTEGILFLGRTATEGPCRVHYFLGGAPTPMVEDGEIRRVGGVYYDADIDLQTQSVEIYERVPRAGDSLVGILYQGRGTSEVALRFAEAEDIEGDILQWPGRSLPAGTGVFIREDDGLKFVGLITGAIAVEASSGEARYLTFAGGDRLREILATPRVHPVSPKVIHRPDDISIRK